MIRPGTGYLRRLNIASVIGMRRYVALFHLRHAHLGITLHFIDVPVGKRLQELVVPTAKCPGA